MKTIDTTLPEQKSSIHWKRIIPAALLSEIAVIVLLSAVIVTHNMVLVPGRTAAEYDDFAQVAGYYLAPPAAALATFLFAFRAVRRLASGFVGNGVLVGAVATLLTLGFIVGARPEHRLMYIVSYVLRIVAGY